ncbi:hypothetical protein [Geodermatophilus nigrescens]|uniref:DUF4367 domain-containing protein n=1 Tax=Geodermatophilus nigrescens TaxID=1070870 RepID=A0A1M5HRH9_9ACTN|nr:hypothetical protein [Geodermatophilus nigrescens]SHG18569.1 hypothetical protein SAMN05444351_1708 [Geodermatophilus nigrescens]
MRLFADRHPTDGTLRRLVDEPAGVADADRAHVAGCDVCLAGLARARADADAVGAALSPAALTLAGTTGAAGTDAAWHRLSAAVAAQARPALVPAPAPARASRWRGALRSPVVAAMGVVVVLGGAGAAAAADWLQVFRTEEVAAVPVSTTDLVGLPDLTAYGDVTFVSEPDVREVADAAAAEDATGLEAPEVAELPTGVTGEPAWTVGGRAVAEFTFSADRAAQAAAAAGETLPPPPAGLDGATFRLEAGPGVAAVWSEARGVPALVVGRVTAPVAYSSGVPFETARDYLLGLPGLPDELAAQLRTFTGDGTTLPLPVPAELATVSTADVDGTEATVLATRDGTLHGVVWVEDGVVTGVAGSLSEDEVLAVARDLG